MNRSRALIALVTASVLAGINGCNSISEPTGPEALPGRLAVSMDGNSPGGVVLMVRGPKLSDAKAADESEVLFARPLDESEGAYTFAVVGDQLAGKLFSFAVPDIHHPELYAVTLQQVANQDNSVAESLDGYAFTIAPEKE